MTTPTRDLAAEKAAVASAHAAVRYAAEQLKAAQKKFTDAISAGAERPWRMPCERCSQVCFLDRVTDLCAPCFDGAGMRGWSM